VVNQALDVLVAIVALELPDDRGSRVGIGGMGQAAVAQYGGMALEGALAEAAVQQTISQKGLHRRIIAGPVPGLLA
jgi:hypothetical protein